MGSKGITVLSLFDGMSCGQIALERAGIKVENYFASEIEEPSIFITQKNYPNTIQLGDVRRVNFFEGSIVAENTWVDDVEVDLLIGGSPCQNFSFAGRNAGMATETGVEILTLEDYEKMKNEGFVFQGESYLFWEYVRLLKECKPKYFLLENVIMKPIWRDVISETLGVSPIRINSSLVSAGLRDRLYWTNIPGVTQPQDKGVLLEGILESGKVDRDKSLCLTKRYVGFAGSQGYMRHRYFGKSMGQAVFEGAATPQEHKELYLKVKRDYSEKHKVDGFIRPLTPLECERIHTIPEGYTEGVSEKYRKEMIGNGWTVDVIAHIFKNLKTHGK